MSSTHSTAVENEPTVTTGNSGNPLEDDPLIPPTVNPYTSRQTWTFLQYLIPLAFVFLFPLIFAICIFAKGQIAAPERLADLAMSNPQVKGQIVAIIATSLTAITRWALGGAAALLARKRLLQPRPVYEIDMFFRLTNISVIWDWKHRRRMAFLTWFLVAVCGLLTSGFFTLLNPLLIDIPYEIGEEVNLGADSDGWMELYSARLYGSLHGSNATRNSSAPSSDIPKFLESMTRQWLTLGYMSEPYPVSTFVTTFEELDTVSFVGSTAGTLAFTLYSEISSFSTELQGTWIGVACSTGAVPLNATVDRHPYDPIMGAFANYSFVCPGSSTIQKGTARLDEAIVAALDCPMEDGSTTIFFHPLVTSIFDSVINISCIVSPRIGEVNVVLDPNLQAYNATRTSSSSKSLPPVARNFTSLVLTHVTRNFQHLPIFSYTKKARHVFGTYSDEDFQEIVLPGLVETILSALFEFEASHMRMELEKTLWSMEPWDIPPDAVRELKGVLIRLTIGWEVKWTTWLGLLPLMAVCIVAFAMIAMAWRSEGKLTVFDPMSPASLLAATSVGEITFPNQALGKTIGDPLDENVLTTRVFYDNKSEIWGLWSLKGTLEDGVIGAV